MKNLDDAFKWLAEQPPDVAFKVLGLDVRIREDAPADRVFFVPTRKTIQRALDEGDGRAEQCEEETGPRRRRVQTSHGAFLSEGADQPDDEGCYCE
jgi:hypothetical protein